MAFAVLRCAAAPLRGVHAWGMPVRRMTIFRSPLKELAIPTVSLVDFVRTRWAQPDVAARTAAFNADTGASITFKELSDRIDATAEALQAKGFKRGDVLSIHMSNNIE